MDWWGADAMADVFGSAKRSDVMSRIRSKGNKDTEQALMQLLRKNRISGWRRHVPIRLNVEKTQNSFNLKPEVMPDFVFRKERVVIFVDGCFWHGCKKHSNLPVNNRSFWFKKLEGNKCRDRQVVKMLRLQRWVVIRVWEHDLQQSRERRDMVEKRIVAYISQALR